MRFEQKSRSELAIRTISYLFSRVRFLIGRMESKFCCAVSDGFEKALRQSIGSMARLALKRYGVCARVRSWRADPTLAAIERRVANLAGIPPGEQLRAVRTPRYAHMRAHMLPGMGFLRPHRCGRTGGLHPYAKSVRCCRTRR